MSLCVCVQIKPVLLEIWKHWLCPASGYFHFKCKHTGFILIQEIMLMQKVSKFFFGSWIACLYILYTITFCSFKKVTINLLMLLIVLLIFITVLCYVMQTIWKRVNNVCICCCKNVLKTFWSGLFHVEEKRYKNVTTMWIKKRLINVINRCISRCKKTFLKRQENVQNNVF